MSVELIVVLTVVTFVVFATMSTFVVVVLLVRDTIVVPPFAFFVATLPSNDNVCVLTAIAVAFIVMLAVLIYVFDVTTTLPPTTRKNAPFTYVFAAST